MFVKIKEMENDNFITSTCIGGIDTGLIGKVYKADKPDELLYEVWHDGKKLNDGKLLIAPGTDNEIDCFTGTASKDKVIKPILKELLKHGYVSSF